MQKLIIQFDTWCLEIKKDHRFAPKTYPLLLNVYFIANPQSPSLYFALQIFYCAHKIKGKVFCHMSRDYQNF